MASAQSHTRANKLWCHFGQQQHFSRKKNFFRTNFSLWMHAEEQAVQKKCKISPTTGETFILCVTTREKFQAQLGKFMLRDHRQQSRALSFRAKVRRAAAIILTVPLSAWKLIYPFISNNPTTLLLMHGKFSDASPAVISQAFIMQHESLIKAISSDCERLWKLISFLN